MPPTILRVGLTGNIAAGKSTVAAWLAELGFHVLDLDALGHDCLRPGESAHDAVIAAFGNQVRRDDGTIDRSALGAIVFADEEARTRLERILHPAIREREQTLVGELAGTGQSEIVVTEAALLYETGADARYHRMVVVTAPDRVRLDRLRSRGLTGPEAQRRMASQMDQAEKARRADYVIENAESLEDARRKVQILAELLRADLAKAAAGEPLGESVGVIG